jgi:type I restriction enzyme S subunit
MSNWKTCQLSDIITFQRGHDLPRTQMTDGQYPVVGSNGIIGYHNEYTTESPSVTIGRSGNVGNPFIVYERSWSHNTTLYIKEYKNADPVFVYYLLRTLDLGNFAGGSAVPTLNRNHIHTIEIAVPPINEQIEIGHILQVLDDKIESNSRINNHLAVSMSATDSSPDIRRGKSVSRVVASVLFSSAFCRIFSMIGTAMSVNSRTLVGVGMFNSYRPIVSPDTRCLPLLPFMFCTA